MDTNYARLLARSLMDKHGLTKWSFGFNNRQRTCGLCRHGLKIIELSKSYVELNTEEKVTNTILHEIAHALVPVGEHHGWAWQTVAKSLGCNAERCASPETINKPGKYVYACMSCGKKYHFYRKTRVMKACKICCDKYNYGKFHHKFILTPMQTKRPEDNKYE